MMMLAYLIIDKYIDITTLSKEGVSDVRSPADIFKSNSSI